jgi:hypothetical protein
MKDNARVHLYWGGSALLSFFVGGLVGRIDGFEFYKLLNLIGLIYDFLAVVLLSYVILAKPKIQEVLAHHVSLAFISFSTILPAGVQVGSLLGGSEIIIDASMYSFILISMLPVVYVFGSPILEPTYNVRFSPEKRIKILGLMFLLMGFVFQIVSSVFDTFLLTRPSI